MKKQLYALFLFFIVSISACHEDATMSRALLRAEALMEAHPDSALLILDSIPSPEKHSEEAYATWCLLITQARDKNYVEHTSDSVINVAVGYFEKGKDVKRKVQAYYYGGRVNEELAQLENALAYYLKARSYAKETTDYHLQGLINMYIGDLQWRLNRQDVALIAHKEAYASFLAEKFEKLSLQASVENDLAILYKEKGEYAKALKYAFLSVSHTSDRDKQGSCYLVIGTSYHKMNRLDSAQFYLEKASSSTQLYTRAGANHALSALYKQQKGYALSEQYLSEYVDCRDSIEAIYNAPKMKELEVRYSKEKAEHEKVLVLCRTICCNKCGEAG